MEILNIIIGFAGFTLGLTAGVLMTDTAGITKLDTKKRSAKK